MSPLNNQRDDEVLSFLSGIPASEEGNNPTINPANPTPISNTISFNPNPTASPNPSPQTTPLGSSFDNPVYRPAGADFPPQGGLLGSITKDNPLGGGNLEALSSSLETGSPSPFGLPNTNALPPIPENRINQSTNIHSRPLTGQSTINQPLAPIAPSVPGELVLGTENKRLSDQETTKSAYPEDRMDFVFSERTNTATKNNPEVVGNQPANQSTNNQSVTPKIQVSSPQFNRPQPTNQNNQLGSNQGVAGSQNQPIQKQNPANVAPSNAQTSSPSTNGSVNRQSAPSKTQASPPQFNRPQPTNQNNQVNRSIPEPQKQNSAHDLFDKNQRTQTPPANNNNRSVLAKEEQINSNPVAPVVSKQSEKAKPIPQTKKTEQKKQDPIKTSQKESVRPEKNKKEESDNTAPYYLATVTVFLSNRTENANQVNKILTDFGHFFLGRIGLPLSKKCLERCSTLIVLAAEIDETNLKLLTKELSSLEGVLAKPLLVKRLG